MYYILPFLILFIWIRCQFWNRQPMTHIYDFPKSGLYITKPLWNHYCNMSVETNGLTSEYNGKIIKSEKRNLFNPKRQDVFFHTMTFDTTLFQTHLFRLMNDTKCMVSIFGSEKRLGWLVPVLRYPIVSVETNTFFNYSLPIKKWTKKDIRILYDIWEPFLFQMSPPLSTLANDMDEKKVVIYSWKSSLFFFKKNEWVGTITKEPIEKAASTLLFQLRKEYPIVRIHQLSHTPFYEGKKTYYHYYIYNYGTKRIYPKDCFLL
jgi:hypothetical protein